MRARWLLASMALACALVLPAQQARAAFVIINNDAAGEGFNDPTPAAPVGGNPGTTVGQQRLNVFVKAGEIWDAILGSSIPIRVQASFDPLSCAPTSGVLGSAGPNAVETDFAQAPYSATWFTSAQANRLAGVDLEPAVDDIIAQFQSNVGTPGCLSTRYWYYGYDGNEGANGLDLLVVLLHEFGHGLGFLTLTDEVGGGYYGGQPTIFDRYLMDNVSNKHWYQMTAAERVASGKNTNHLVWDGPAVTTWAPRFLGKRAHVVASGALTGDFISGQGVFYPPLTLGGISGDVVLVNDGVGTTSDGCDNPFINAAQVAGKVALLDRSSTCTIPQQSLNAQNAGAIAAIIVNNVAGPEPQLRGAAPTVTIPVASLSLNDGNAMKAALGSGTVTVTIALDPNHLAGVDDAGRVLMYAPNPGQPGSSVSHFDVSPFPNLLMEPSINPDVTQVDLTKALFFDIGWFPQLVDVGRQPGADLALAAIPNPATAGGLLRFRLPEARVVDLTVYDVSGRAVAHLAHGMMPAGEQSVRWTRRDDQGRRVDPGVYLVRLRSGDIERTAHLVLMD
jgi:PA domain/FlgD Ig-like domain